VSATRKDRRKKPTIYDVAERAGVSTFTVSRVINNSGFVREETRKRVEEAVEELGYVPSAVARKLSTRRANSIALLISDVTNPFWGRITSTIQEFFSGKGMIVILSNTRSDPTERRRQLDMALAQGIDGVIFVPVGQDPLDDKAFVHELQRRNVPCVALDRDGDLGIDTVRGDSVGGAFALTEHLLSLGHRRIALVNGPHDHPTAVERHQGYASALNEADLAVDEALVRWGGYRMGHGVQATEELLALSDPPTAIVATNNWLAAGVLNALNAHGIQVPAGMAVVGFDELPSLSSFLTVIAQSVPEMGYLAAEMLYERIQGYDGDPREHVLPVELRVRASSGEPVRQADRQPVET
jgi:LacI family transcriptional regulator